MSGIITVPETRRLLEQAIKEVCHVAKARGVMLSGDTVEKTIKILDETTPSGTASLQRDIAAGKRSELESWIGAVVRFGAEAGVDTPVHSFIYGSLLPTDLRARGEIKFPQ